MIASSDTSPAKLWIGIARGCGGALLFGLPLYMTSEMWVLGFSVDPLRGQTQLQAFFAVGYQSP